MTELNIYPQATDKREKFIARTNEIIKLEETIASAKESIKSLYDAAAEDFLEDNDDVKKGEYTKRHKLLTAEHLAAKATEQNKLTEEVLDVYELTKGKLI